MQIARVKEEKKRLDQKIKNHKQNLTAQLKELTAKDRIIGEFNLERDRLNRKLGTANEEKRALKDENKKVNRELSEQVEENSELNLLNASQAEQIQSLREEKKSLQKDFAYLQGKQRRTVLTMRMFLKELNIRIFSGAASAFTVALRTQKLKTLNDELDELLKSDEN